MYKKVISLLLALMLAVSMITIAVVCVSADDSTYVVAGSAELCGYSWEGNADLAPENAMTEIYDGVYQKTFYNVAQGVYEFKVVRNNVEWIGDSMGENFKFNVSSPCDVSVTINSKTYEVTFTGAYVDQDFDSIIDYICLAGNGDESWLNTSYWDPSDFSNKMYLLYDNVYCIEFNDLKEYDNYQFRFAANGSWDIAWSGEFEGFGIESVAYFNSMSNIIINTTGLGVCDITITLDLTEFDYDSKLGAKFKIDAVSKENIESTAVNEYTQPTTVESAQASTADLKSETKAVDSTENASTEVIDTSSEAYDYSKINEDLSVESDYGAFLTVNVISNYFPNVVAKYNKTTKQITVTYSIKLSKDMLDTQWQLYYDPSVLVPALNDSGKNINNKNTICPTIGSSAGPINLAGTGDAEGRKAVKYSATNVSLFDFSSEKKIFASVVFDVVAENPVETNIDFFVDILRISEINEDTGITETAKEVMLVKNGVISDSTEAKKVSVDKTTSVTSSTYVEPATSATVTNPTTEALTTAKTEPVTEIFTTTAPPATEAPKTTAPPTTEAQKTTAVPTTVEPTTVEPTTDPAVSKLALTVNATSNYFPEASALYNPKTKEVVVTYYIKASKNMLDTQWYVTYDPEILSVSDKNNTASICPAVGNRGASCDMTVISDGVGYISYKAADISLYDISSAKTPFATLIFDVKGDSLEPLATTVDLVIDVLRVSKADADGININSEEVLLIDKQTVLDNGDTHKVNVDLSTVLSDSTYVEPITEEITAATDSDNTSGTSDIGTEEITEKYSSSATIAPASDATSVIESSGSATADSSTPDNVGLVDGPVQTGNASFALIILCLLIGATCVMFVLRKKEKY